MLILPGVEFSTEYGHLLALFLSQEISYTTWEETTKQSTPRGGVTVLAHPFQKSHQRRPSCRWSPIWMGGGGVEQPGQPERIPRPTPRQRRLPARPAWSLPPKQRCPPSPGSGGRYSDPGGRGPLFGGHSQCDLGLPRDPGWAGGPLAVRGAEPVHETEKNARPPSVFEMGRFAARYLGGRETSNRIERRREPCP